MTLASATFGASSPAIFLNWREETRHDRSPLALLAMPEPQPVTPAKRTLPTVCRRGAGAVVPIPTLPAASRRMRSRLLVYKVNAAETSEPTRTWFAIEDVTKVDPTY